MLEILDAGMLSMIQDAGRQGYRQLGISQSGALDLPALQIANLLVGNNPDMAAIEITLGQFSVRFNKSCWIALTGAGCNAHLDSQPVWTGWRYLVKPGQVLVLHKPSRGMRSYFAVSGGIDVSDVLGSKSTDLTAKIGGLSGQVLQDGDKLSIGQPMRELTKSVGVQQLLFNTRVRVLPGPEYDEFTKEAQSLFWQTAWQLSPNSNRMGYRLKGPELKRSTEREMLSHGLLPGVIQVPHNGLPIVLMADAQTTGGYPRIGCVIAADLYHLAQIRLGELIHFVPCTLEEAEKAFQAQQRFIKNIEWGLYGN